MIYLKALRLVNGLTLVELEKLVGVTGETLCRIEAGTYDPGKHVTQNLEEYFKLPIETLLKELPSEGTITINIIKE